MEELIKESFNKYGFMLNDVQIKQFAHYFEYLVQENEKFNLTAITEQKEVVFKHFVDSVLPIDYFEHNASIIDVGSGAGFPGIPIKILRPDLKIVLIDSLQKRVNFLNETIKILGLKEIKAFHSRAEDFAKDNREKFDYSVSRAVAQINTLAEYLLPFVKVGGKTIMYKSQKVQEELAQGEKAISEMGGKVKAVDLKEIKEFEAERTFVVVQKIRKTPLKYPRNKNLPKTKPIC